ncbi:MAG TPA: HlyD family efflux transporter periplasmic adaptor subunit, partial [Steroidobacteraceae bacterium]|nr:HlyD family efflux transporter periplasmic adaptor subunit [Steroidobacteraceae bacterium]
MPADSKLFRDQALAAARTQTLGTIVLIRPLSLTVLTSIVVALAAATALFLGFGTYAQRSTVTGQLVSDAGLVKVYAPQAGIVLERHVIEGSTVKAGDVLFIVSSERSSVSQGATQEAISGKVREREASLKAELESTRVLERTEREALESKILGLHTELRELDAQRTDQASRVKIAEESLSRYQKLKADNLVSSEQVGEKTGELLDQRTHLQTLDRDDTRLNQELSAARAELAGLPLKQQSRRAELDRLLASASEELAESEAKRRLVITAPEAGTATAVLATAGQAIDPAKPLLSIVPAGASLHAELFAPSRAVGFVRPGDRVLIRYAAFPFEKFGHQQGRVESVSRTALPVSELNAMDIADSRGEPLYRINV